MNPATTVQIFIISGLVLAVVCAVFAGCFGLIYNAIVESVLVIDEDGAIYDTWTAPDVPLYLKFYLFNVTNPEGVQYYGQKPILQEFGPYVYEEMFEKLNVTFYDSEGTVEYVDKTTYTFNREMSIGDESDEYTMLNLLMVVLGSRFGFASPVTRSIGELLTLRFNLKEKLFITKSVKEILFDGYYDPFLQLLGELADDPISKEGMFGYFYKILGSVGYDNEAIISAWPIIEEYGDLFEVYTVGDFFFYGFDLPVFLLDTPFGTKNLTLYDILTFFGGDNYPQFLQDNVFALFYGANGTAGSTYKVNTGEEDMEEYLYIQEYEGQEQLDYWNSSYCNMINGTDGTQFPPGVEREDVLYIFVSDICRSLYATYEQDLRQHDEVNTYRFIVPYSVLADPNVYDENACYCTKVYVEDETCLGAGMLNLAPCAGGIPIVISTPHFYMGDPDVIDKLVGIEPQKSLHETFFDVEPVTGVVLSGAKRIQVNLPLRNYGNLTTFQKVPECILPIFWLDEGASINEEDATSLQNVLTIPFIIVYTVCATLIAVGLVLVIIGARRRRDLINQQKGYHKKPLSSEEKD